MASVNVLNVSVLNNPCPFKSGFAFEVTFEAVAPLKHGA